MENLHLFEIPWIVLLQKQGLDGLHFYRILSFLGAEVFYLLVPILLLGIDRSRGIAFTALLLLGNTISSLLKLGLHWPRPYWVDDRIIALTPLETSYGMPSGHALFAFSLWGFLALEYPRRGGFLLAMILASAVGLSRVYLGVHWPSDVLAGAALGCVILWIFRRSWPNIQPRLQRLSSRGAVLWSLFFSGSILGLNLLVCTLWAPDPDPASWKVNPVFARAIDPRSAGMLLGLGIGFTLARRAQRTALPNSTRARVIQTVLGAAGIGLLLVWMKSQLNKISPEWAAHTEFPRSFLAGLWLAHGAPWLRTQVGTPRRGVPVRPQPDGPQP